MCQDSDCGGGGGGNDGGDSDGGNDADGGGSNDGDGGNDGNGGGDGGIGDGRVVVVIVIVLRELKAVLKVMSTVVTCLPRTENCSTMHKRFFQNPKSIIIYISAHLSWFFLSE